MDGGDSTKPKKSKKPILVGVGVVAAVAVALGVLFGTHIICFHDWAPANCTQGKHCYSCGKTEGEPVPDAHGWNEAICCKPKNCGYCGLTEGEPNYENHWWQDATCLQPMTCGWCGDQKGNVIGHKYDDGVCEMCGISAEVATRESAEPEPEPSHSVENEEAAGQEKLAELTESEQATLSDAGARFTPAEFCEDMDEAFAEINRELDFNFEAKSGDVDGARVCAVMEDGEQVFAFAFVENGEEPIYDKNSRATTHLLGMDIGSGSDDSLSCSLIALVMTLHPSLDISDAIDICTEILETCADGDIHEYDGVKYYITMEDGDTTMIVSLI